MAEYAPQAIRACFNTIKAGIPSAILSGIVGDRNHTYGYHRGRDFVGSGDYSRQRADDKLGNGQAASALDISLNPANMKAVTQRLINASLAGNANIQVVREFFGTVNGSSVTGLDVRDKRWVTSDSSHLWHVHISFYRRWADDQAALQRVASIVTGSGQVTPPPPPPPPPPPGKKGPMYGKPVPAAIAKGTGRYYGSIDGPGNSLGGFNAAERPAIKLIQQQLIFLGFVPGQTNINSGWADGIFDTKGGGVGRGPTSQAVTRFQKKYMPNTQYYGQVWYDDWQKLASM